MPLQGFQCALGIVIDDIAKDCVTAHIEVTECHMNSGGAVHGGVLMSLADNVGAIGALKNLGPSQRTATLESKSSFIKACAGTRISAECRPLHLGRKTSVWHTVLRDDKDRICAHVWQTQLHVDS